MIYIFKGIGAVCKAPCTACEACCKCCGSCGDAISKACSECCDSWRRFWEPVANNPLGTYVMGTWVAMAFATGAAGWALGNLKECDEDAKGKLALFCIADIVLAVMHGAMAYYMQRQIVHGLGDKEYSQMSAKEIQMEAGRILLYDVPVCLYFFIANAAWAFNIWGLVAPWGSCGDTQPQLGAAFLMIAWGTCAGAYLFCWYCCQCCAGTVSSIQRPGTRKPGAGTTVVGVPAAPSAPQPQAMAESA
jgi:hypothetical protein